MHPDVLEIENFYRRAALGRFATRQLTRRVAETWDDLQGMTVVGFGYTPPVCKPVIKRCARLISLMPERQGALAWPVDGPVTTVLTHESEWPLTTGMADRIVMMHGLETSLNAASVLDECWRVLAPEGRALIIVPNRAGIWARRDLTPFGSGRPFTASQLTRLLGNRRFGVIAIRAALFAPPSEHKFWIRMAQLLERTGSRYAFRFAGGVLLAEVNKRVFQPHRPPLAETVASKLKALEGMAAPGTRPVSNRDHNGFGREYCKLWGNSGGYSGFRGVDLQNMS
ncbi:MAG: hypothetical protein OXE84_14450 [Rhodobacteraceae bacterium]|nr:hypothetical protein [Paracoccaceae bacterium]